MVDIKVDKGGSCDWSKLRQYKNEVKEISEYFLDYVNLGKIEILSESFKSRYPLYWKEMEQIALIGELDPIKIFLLNVLYDVLSGVCACTVLSMNTKEGPLHCHCLDWEIGRMLLSKNTTLFNFISEDGEKLFSSISWPGFIGSYYGFSANKFAITLNAVWSEEERFIEKPLGLELRESLFKLNSFKTVIKHLSSVNLSCDAILTISGTNPDDLAIIERTPTKSAEKRSPDCLYATNHYTELKFGKNKIDYVAKKDEPFGENSFERFLISLFKINSFLIDL